MSSLFEILAPESSSGMRMGLFVEPDIEMRLTSPFGNVRPNFGGRAHTGSDWAPVVRREGDRVIWSAPDALVCDTSETGESGWGHFFFARFPDNERARWLLMLPHLRERPPVSSGDEIRRGQFVGHLGSTGYSTGPHHHVMCGYAAGFDGGAQLPLNERYAKFWRNPRDDQGGVSLLADPVQFMVDELTEDRDDEAERQGIIDGLRLAQLANERAIRYLEDD